MLLFETHVLNVKTCEVLELGGLGYFTKYPSPLGSSTSLGNWVDGLRLPYLTQLSTRAWWARVLCEVPEPTKLEYFTRGPLGTVWTVWPTKLLIYFFLFTIVGSLQGSLFNFFIYLFIQCGPRVFFCFFFFFILGQQCKILFLLIVFFLIFIFFIYTTCNVCFFFFIVGQLC